MLGVGGFKVNGPRDDVDVLENESEDTSVRPRWQDASGWMMLCRRDYLEFSTE